MADRPPRQAGGLLPPSSPAWRYDAVNGKPLNPEPRELPGLNVNIYFGRRNNRPRWLITPVPSIDISDGGPLGEKGPQENSPDSQSPKTNDTDDPRRPEVLCWKFDPPPEQQNDQELYRHAYSTLQEALKVPSFKEEARAYIRRLYPNETAQIEDPLPRLPTFPNPRPPLKRQSPIPGTGGPKYNWYDRPMLFSKVGSAVSAGNSVTTIRDEASVAPTPEEGIPLSADLRMAANQSPLPPIPLEGVDEDVVLKGGLHRDPKLALIDDTGQIKFMHPPKEEPFQPATTKEVPRPVTVQGIGKYEQESVGAQTHANGQSTTDKENNPLKQTANPGDKRGRGIGRGIGEGGGKETHSRVPTPSFADPRLDEKRKLSWERDGYIEEEVQAKVRYLRENRELYYPNRIFRRMRMWSGCDRDRSTIGINGQIDQLPPFPGKLMVADSEASPSHKRKRGRAPATTKKSRAAAAKEKTRAPKRATKKKAAKSTTPPADDTTQLGSSPKTATRPRRSKRISGRSQSGTKQSASRGH
ncbi:uncharacterized protein BO97DRAFT_426122 [Aspergillus homomorphus CBS 101889]|uniref:Uncharacterized protein n=1 Tax=Aspergillus homomorphus (strain CBS 101889) TaxID=1450537 RepID=A0A395HSX2_ASPHC|nr:hypothetical protein BO97DRAFT_426122 [Aspergillus homomorphus CBS 101889]RAL10880.1 hypothetical protein BO97DRAFT_426122 [Aspergillus homomorphus CBS 101889]